MENYAPGHFSLYSLAIDKGSYFYDKKGYKENIFPMPDINE